MTEAPRTVAERLLDRLDRLGEVLARRGDALGLVAVGSVGADRHRLDEHSDLDFFAVVEDSAKPAYLASVDWLEELAPVAFSFANTPDGRKVLFEDGLFAEYAVFTLAELRAASSASGRTVWRRSDAPDDLHRAAAEPGAPDTTVGREVNEALTNLYVGLHRELRGERLSAMRFVQVHAVDRLVTALGLVAGVGPQQDPYAVERGAERRFGADLLPWAELAPGYGHTGDAAMTLLACLERHFDPDPTMVRAVRALAHRSRATRASSQTGSSDSRT